ncbi:Transposon TX1 uncharacterized 149 kDa protein [Vitis vinifera]|uniref:Transposon TX1 uncharacterized 149 kDa protein n=1 Tax=Vitis vinifera TaxID=29760 RepID=A0A438E0M0_VITVI|nr:Transposon TX1 uncharacterized 149 kDa protein [Vitis vinifera]
MVKMEVGNSSISWRFKNCEDGFYWIFSGVYGPTVKVEREDFFSELGAIRGLWNEPLCVTGDFNMIRFPSDRSRGGRLSPTIRRFSEVVKNLELRDLPLQGAYSRGVEVVLARPISDHSPILLDGGGMRKGLTPFRFENIPGIDGLNFERLEELDVEGLEKAFLEEEFSWDFVMEKVMNFYRQFHETRSFVRSLNATFLVSIPKKGRVEDLKDFRPISLGRQIMDAMLIVNEAIDSILKSNKGVIFCKLDIEEAYDHVDWSFLLAVLENMGFGDRWCRWIKWCLSTVRFSVLVNGSPTGFFQSSRDLRQGDPLSPYLFVVVMEAFSCMLKKAVVEGFLTPLFGSGKKG